MKISQEEIKTVNSYEKCKKNERDIKRNKKKRMKETKRKTKDKTT